MIGKEFKEFALKVADDAIVEVKSGSYMSSEFVPLTANAIRAITRPAQKQETKEEE